MPIARCTVEAPDAGPWAFSRVIRGKPVRTTIQDKAAPCPLDHVNRVSSTRQRTEPPLALRLHLRFSTWSGFVYVAFVIDAYARRIVGWRVSQHGSR